MNEGYWAESLPLVEAPLCAVIDPVRDYRWHALRCGGPETAAFLCELEGEFDVILFCVLIKNVSLFFLVPDWALDCTLKAMPGVTVQYLSDSGAVELSRECNGITKEISCQGRQVGFTSF